MVMRDTAKLTFEELNYDSYFIYEDGIYAKIGDSAAFKLNCHHATEGRFAAMNCDAIVYPIKLEEIFYSYA